MRFRLVYAAKKDFPVARLCKVLDVSPRGYFAWKNRPASTRQREDLVLLAHVRSAFTLSHKTYGSPRMTQELREQGLAAGRRRAARLMRENGLKARQPRGIRRATVKMLRIIMHVILALTSAVPATALDRVRKSMRMSGNAHNYLINGTSTRQHLEKKKFFNVRISERLGRNHDSITDNEIITYPLIDPLVQGINSSFVSTYAAYAVNMIAIGDGTTDDAATLRAAANAVIDPGTKSFGSLTLHSARGYRVGSTVTLPNGQHWEGSNATQGIMCAVNRGPCLVALGSRAGIKNLPISFVGIPGNGSIGVQMGAGEQGDNAILRDVKVAGFDTGIDIQSGTTGKLENVSVDGSKNIGIRSRNIHLVDAGDWTWTGVKVDMLGTSGNGVNLETGGGLKVLGYKGLGGAIGFNLAIPDRAGTQDLQFTSSSIENSGVACMKLGRSGTTGVYGQITIIGSEFAGCPIAIWLANAGVGSIAIGNNNFALTSDTPIRIDPGVQNVAVSLNTYTSASLVQDNRTNFQDDLGFIDRRDQKPIQSDSAINWTTAYTVRVPSYRGARVRVFFEGIQQGVGAFSRDETYMLTANGSKIIATLAGISAKVNNIIDFKIDTYSENEAKIQFRIGSGTGIIQGTASIDVVGKAVTVKR